ncbi:hypothetical protein HYH03_010820 [Edaphochlamys debaryana]|uniref:Uncharacterized protein n=1 Tax=Edaphochlamys debaryana TaxID=47281 RepID=A0A835XTH9_9CHLO|nr:hypothetical protein HYH03_010820 [Edaphochlamys debaryana]|eukprot:KAG2490907.1 hypothetical protein HYH03_010820 [Edaphochlamys debaryana]
MRWRSPAKPHKLARLHASDTAGAAAAAARAVAVRGLQLAGEDEDSPIGGGHGSRAGGPTPGQARGGSGPGSSGLSGKGPTEAPGAADKSPVNQPEWGRLFRALSLGSGGSQRTDPVWAAAGNNRGATAKRPALLDASDKPASAGPAAAVAGSLRGHSAAKRTSACLTGPPDAMDSDSDAPGDGAGFEAGFAAVETGPGLEPPTAPSARGGTSPMKASAYGLGGSASTSTSGRPPLPPGAPRAAAPEAAHGEEVEVPKPVRSNSFLQREFNRMLANNASLSICPWS